MTAPRRTQRLTPTCAPITPDFWNPPSAETEALRLRCEHQQRIIDDLRRNCSEYRKLIKFMQTITPLKPTALGRPARKGKL